MVGSQSPSPFCVIGGNWLAKEAMASSKLLCHLEMEYPALKDTLLEFFKGKKVNMKNRSSFLIEDCHFIKSLCLESIIFSG